MLAFQSDQDQGHFCTALHRHQQGQQPGSAFGLYPIFKPQPFFLFFFQLFSQTSSCHLSTSHFLPFFTLSITLSLSLSPSRDSSSLCRDIIYLCCYCLSFLPPSSPSQWSFQTQVSCRSRHRYRTSPSFTKTVPSCQQVALSHQTQAAKRPNPASSLQVQQDQSHLLGQQDLDHLQETNGD